ncbi:hypothetical protein CRUP_007602, partial [Coryphaenoides rupestris]
MAKEVVVSKAFAIGVVTLTVSAIAGPPPNLRLPGNMVPERYLLYLKPHLYSSLNTSDVNATEQTSLFTGNSTVFFQCVQKTQSLFLHSKNLTLLEVRLMDEDDRGSCCPATTWNTTTTPISWRKSTTALGNWEQAGGSVILDEEWLLTTFKTTEPMSTYLLAFGVSEFDCVKTTTDEGSGMIAIKTYTRKEALNAGQAVYANDAARDILTFFIRRFGTYSLNKLDQFVVPDHRAAAMENWEEIQTYNQIGQMFSTITYFKGATVLRMLADAMTERAFDAGVKAYDKTGIDDIADIAEMMNTWTTQIGYPVVTINTMNGAVYQKQFTLDPSTESGREWIIPVRVRSAIAASQILILLKADSPERMEEFRSTDGEWILANINASGYYRVNYDPENWRRLMDELERNLDAIPLMSRGQLIDDAFNLASLLEYTLDPEENHNLDVLGTIRLIGQNPVGQSLAWDFIRAHWTYLHDMYGRGASYVLRQLADRFNTDFALQELKQFQMTQNAMDDMLMNEAIETTQANIFWVKENKLTILKWFLTELSGGGGS